MARPAKPIIQKLREQILELPHEDAAALASWLEDITEVREADAAAAKRRAATADAVDKHPVGRVMQGVGGAGTL